MRGRKLEKLAVVASMVEKASARELSVSHKSHQDKCDQLEQLLRFREEYEADLRQKSLDGMSSGELQDYRMFLGKLNHAIEEQKQLVDVASAELEGVEANYRSKSQRKQALDHLVDQRQRELAVTREKAEQKASDERAMSMHNSDQEDKTGM